MSLATAGRLFGQTGLQSTAIRTFATKKSSDKKEKKADVRESMPSCVKTTSVQICGPLYQQFKDIGRKRYKDVPLEGIVTKAEYFDNKNLVGQGNGTVVMLPGSPGYFTHYSTLIEFLTKRGVRVVSPNFPTLTLTKETKYFRHSPEERVEFLKAVLLEAGVDSIDLMASHSSGTFASARFWKDETTVPVKSFAMFNPLGFEITVPMKPYWFSRGFVKTWQSDTGRFALEKIGVPLLVKLGNPFAKNGLEDIVWGGCCLHYNDRKKFKANMEEMTANKVPLLMVIADNDAVMNKQMSSKLVDACGSSIDDSYLYDKDGKLERVAMFNGTFKLLRSRGGGHFSFIKYPSIVNQAVADHLDKVLKKEPQTVTVGVKQGHVDQDMDGQNDWEVGLKRKEVRGHLLL